MKLLIFDFDGVIGDTLDFVVEIFLSVCKRLSIEQIQTKEDFLRLFDTNLYEGFEKAGLNKESSDEILKEVRKLTIKNSGVRSFPNVRKMIKRLHKNHRLIIISSNKTENVKKSLMHNEITEFDDVLGGDIEKSKVKKIKGLEEKYQDMDYFYIGDTKGDMIEGHEAGCKTIGVTWGWHSEEKIKEGNPDYIVSSPDELVELIERL